MKVAVGSTNPVKVAAVQHVVQRLWPDAVVIPVEVAPGVPEMPMSDAESQAGAQNRAQAALALTQSDLGVGLEGGVNLEPIGLVLHGWVVVVDGHGRTGIGGAGRLPLPETIARRVLAGEELGPVMDDILGQTEVRKQGGAIGALTAGLVVRQEAFAQGVAYALAPFVAPQWYEPVSGSADKVPC